MSAHQLPFCSSLTSASSAPRCQQMFLDWSLLHSDKGFVPVLSKHALVSQFIHFYVNKTCSGHHSNFWLATTLSCLGTAILWVRNITFVCHFHLILLPVERTRVAKPHCNLKMLAGGDSKSEEIWNLALALKNHFRRNSAVDLSMCQHRNPAPSWNARVEETAGSPCAPTPKIAPAWAGVLLTWPPWTSVPRVGALLLSQVRQILCSGGWSAWRKGFTPQTTHARKVGLEGKVSHLPWCKTKAVVPLFALSLCGKPRQYVCPQSAGRAAWFSHIHTSCMLLLGSTQPPAPPPYLLQPAAGGGACCLCRPPHPPLLPSSGTAGPGPLHSARVPSPLQRPASHLGHGSLRAQPSCPGQPGQPGLFSSWQQVAEAGWNQMRTAKWFVNNFVAISEGFALSSDTGCCYSWEPIAGEGRAVCRKYCPCL